MPSRFCPSCGSANHLREAFCGSCGIPLVAPEPAVETSEGSPISPGADPVRRSRKSPPPGLINPVVLVVVVAAVAIGLVLSQPAAWTFSTASNRTHEQYHSVPVASAVNRSLAPGGANAAIYAVSIPANATNVTITGNLSVDPCVPALRLCVAWIAVVTPANWSAYVSGLALFALWCPPLGAPLCQPEPAVPDFTTPDLSVRAGTTLDLVVWSTLLLPLTASWNAQLHYSTRG